MLSISDKLLEKLHQIAALHSRLSAAEVQVVQMAVQGLKAPAIAKHLHKSRKTIERQLGSVTKKGRDLFGDTTLTRQRILYYLHFYYFVVENQ
jgi:FixJ family two-component response regulator